MKRWTAVLAGIVALALVTDLLMAQPPQRQQRPGFRQGGGPGGPGGQPGMGRGMQGGMRGGMMGGMQPMRPPLMIALDTDNDGEISAEEIARAAKALKTLDKNGDGKLTAEEIRPPFAGMPPRDPGQDGPPPRGPGQGGFGQGGPGQGAPAGIAERIMSMDKNKDGKVTKDEMPEPMQRMLNVADTNKDGAIDKEEAQAMGQRGRGAGGPPRGPATGGRPGQGRRPAPATNTPQW